MWKIQILLATVTGTIAIVVASNQPFYPLYLHAIVGVEAWPAWLTLLSTPFFLAVPAVAGPRLRDGNNRRFRCRFSGSKMRSDENS